MLEMCPKFIYQNVHERANNAHNFDVLEDVFFNIKPNLPHSQINADHTKKNGEDNT